MRPTSRRCRPLDPLNDERPLRVVRTASGALGVVDERWNKVWVGRNLASERCAWTSAVELPEIPAHYGAWHETSIGGLSDTVRRVGIVHADPRHVGAVVVFATHCPEHAEVEIARALASWSVGHAVGDVDVVDGHGRVVEVVVYDPSELGRACALIARAGGHPELEDPTVDAARALGIERLDRIDAHIVSHDTNMEHEDADAYGVRRGRENWRFPWVPPEWTRAPITLDHMVENLLHENIAHVSQPLQQHVARRRLELELFDPMGTLWVREDVPPTARELEIHAQSSARSCAQTEAPFPFRTILDAPELSARLVDERSVEITPDEQRAWGLAGVTHSRFLVRGADGRWYRPRDTLNRLQSLVPKQRRVSCALSTAQSKQLVTVFYLLMVEGVADLELREALYLVMYRYMVERAYTSRRMGKYTQRGEHIGNGSSFRPFRRLSQYAPDRLPAEVLTKLCGRDGRLRARGSKGTRSKYKTANRYRPRRRLARTRDDEEDMVNEEHALPAFEVSNSLSCNGVVDADGGERAGPRKLQGDDVVVARAFAESESGRARA